MKTLTIGQLAGQADVGVETVRFYERKGLLEEPERRPSGYRQYDAGKIIRKRGSQQTETYQPNNESSTVPNRNRTPRRSLRT